MEGVVVVEGRNPPQEEDPVQKFTFGWSSLKCEDSRENSPSVVSPVISGGD